MSNSRNNITGNEDGEYQLRGDGTVLPAEPRDEDTEDGVDASGDEYGCGNNEKVLHNKVYEVIGVLLSGEIACHVASNLKDKADSYCHEPPCPVSGHLPRVKAKRYEKENCSRRG